MDIKKFFRRVNYHLKWFFNEGKWIITFPSIIFMIPGLVLISNQYDMLYNPESVLNIAGFALEICGIISIVYGINDKLTGLKRGGIRDLYINWWGKRPSKTQFWNVGKAVVAVGIPPAQVKIEWFKDEWSIEKKVEQLIEYVRYVEGKLEKSEEKVESKLSNLRIDFNTKIKSLTEKTDEIELSMHDSLIGNIDKELTGVVAVLMGVIYSFTITAVAFPLSLITASIYILYVIIILYKSEFGSINSKT